MRTWGFCESCGYMAWSIDGDCEGCVKSAKGCPHGRTTFCKHGCFQNPKKIKKYETEKLIVSGCINKSNNGVFTVINNSEVEEFPSKSPAWKRQFCVQGSSSAPYIVSLSVIDAKGWECSCPAWTRNTPRSDCKHILKAKLHLVNKGDKVGSEVPTEKPSATVKAGRRFR